MAIITGTAGNDTLAGSLGADRFDGGAGIDTVDYTFNGGSTYGVSVNLYTGVGEYTGGAAGDLYTGVENAIGSAYGDGLTGDSGANVLNGGGSNDYLTGLNGADTLIGGAGTDYAYYTTSIGPVVVDLSLGIGKGFQAEGDRLIGIEGVFGSGNDDTLIGSSGSDLLAGGSSEDTLRGGPGNDYLDGGIGDDVLLGGAGADKLDGGLNSDFASYQGSAAAVAVDLTTGIVSGGDAQGDTLISIESLYGSGFADRLSGSTSRNTFYGELGNDTLSGGRAEDLLSGGAGNDLLNGGMEADQLDGGDGVDTASYVDSYAAVQVSLLTGKTYYAEAQGDVLIGIENLTGSKYNDALEGNAGANTLQGQDGNDLIIGRGGKDTLTGGAGADRFYVTAVADSMSGANADLITDFSHAQRDRIDLSLIDANTSAAGDQAFTYLGTGLFTGVAGQLHSWYDAGKTIVSGDTNGDKLADFAVALSGILPPVAADFVL